MSDLQDLPSVTNTQLLEALRRPDPAGYQNAMASGDPAADRNHDGVLDARDYVAFLDAYRAGQR